MSKHGRVQPPWSEEGWYSDEADAAETDVDRYARAGEGRFRSRAHDHRRPGMGNTPAMHNPYWNFVLLSLGLWISTFLLGKLSEVLWLAIPMVVLMAVVYVSFAVVGALRIPAWHRARRRAREYISEHGGQFPQDLRWYT